MDWLIWSAASLVLLAAFRAAWLVVSQPRTLESLTSCQARPILS